MKHRLIALASAALCTAAAPVSAQLAYDMVGSSSLNLNSYSTNAPAFGSAGDGFQKYQYGVTGGFPFTLVDATDPAYSTDPEYFAGDTLGVVGLSNRDEWFGIVDSINGDNTGPLTATWDFDISSATLSDLAVSIDMAAMGDFEAADYFTITAAIDGGSATTLFSSTVDEEGTLNYTMDDGSVQSLDDPILVDGVALINDFATFTAALSGSGTSLVIALTAEFDGGSEGVAFQNLVIAQVPEPSTYAFLFGLIGLGAVVLYRRRKS